MRRFLQTPLITVSLLLTPAGAITQVTWQEVSPTPIPQAFGSYAMVYHRARDEIVMYGAGGNVWTFDGTGWNEHPTANQPTTLSGHAMAYDTLRDRVVLFGGLGGLIDETWEWDGIDWIQRFPATTPGPRAQHAMVYDDARGRTVMYGGAEPGGLSNETWEWDGNDWTQVMSFESPPARNLHAMAYDPVRARTVLFGGRGENGFGRDDTWEFDGTDWVRTATTGPPDRLQHVMAYDAQKQRVFLYGGTGQQGTWEWDGTSWAEQNPNTEPSPRTGAAAAYHQGLRQVVLFGGTNTDETWGWDGNDWSRILDGKPRFVSLLSTNVDGRILVADSSNDEMWTWNGTVWSFIDPPFVPPFGRWIPPLGQMVLDEARGRVVMFGGPVGPNLPETWEWDGSDWEQRFPTNSPVRRDRFGMAYDAGRERVVVFGGRDGSTHFADLWEWDGNDWEELTPPTGPEPRFNPSMTYDGLTGKVMLFGGLVPQVGTNNETWLWDGSAWTQVFPPNSPPPRWVHAMSYDTARQRVVVHGGRPRNTSTFFLQDTWEWTGSDWVQRSPLSLPGETVDWQTYDSQRGKTVMIVSEDEIYEYGPTNPASYAPFGSGCSGSAGTPVLSSAQGLRPWIDDSLAQNLGPLAPGAPAFLAFGASNSSWGPVLLPFNLAFLGAPTCDILVSFDLVVPLPNATGTASHTLAIPNDPTLLGASVYCQGGAADPGAPDGLTLSNAATLTFGAK